MANIIQEQKTKTEPAPTPVARSHLRPHFRLRTLLLAPLLVTILLFVIFPKLITGDFVDATVASIRESGSSLTIEFDVWSSSRTSFGTELSYGPFSSSGFSSRRIPQWGRLLSTWPEHYLVTINLGVNRKKLPTDMTSTLSLVKLGEREFFHIDVDHPVIVAAGKSNDGQQGKCTFKVSGGSRLGL
jgi:hypothetical protein